ncbi:MAG: aminotransferase class IV [Candidatus Omnitrophota bacterium]|jgi:branched-subunit amino acid aminotransferase/4-amino-4-deoxychorismate lyase
MRRLGIFETIRVKEGKIVYFDQHLSRIIKSSCFFKIKLPCSREKLAGLILESVKKAGIKDGRLKVIIRQGPHRAAVQILIQKYKPFPKNKYREGFRVTVSPFRQNELRLARHKTTGRLLYDLSFKQAKKAGYDEALILNKFGYLTEATRSNVFFARSGKLFTPDAKCGCLEGITRRAVKDLALKHKIKVCEGEFRLEDIASAQEAFLTNSLMGIMPFKGKCGKITKLLIEEYNCLLK